MRSIFDSRSAVRLGVFALLISPFRISSQSVNPRGQTAETLPTAPEPGAFSGSVASSSLQAPSGEQTGNQRSSNPKSQHDLAEEQLKQQEKQRVMGVMATFNTTRNPDAVPLSPRQKFKLFFRSSTDPWPFLLAGAVGGIGQAANSNPEWGRAPKVMRSALVRHTPMRSSAISLEMPFCRS